MNCYKCQKRIETPNPNYSVAELVEMCRPHCLKCNPEQMPRGGHSQVQVIEDAIGYVMPGNSVDETGDDKDEQPANAEGEAFQKIHYDYQLMKDAGHAEIFAGIPEDLAAEIEPIIIELLKRFAALDIADVDILHGLLNGMSCEQMALAFGYKSRPAVHARLKNALKRNPWMKEIYTRGSTYGIRELHHSSPSYQKKIKRPFTRGRGMVLAGVSGADPDALAK